jgi:signal transduction histidine kinase
MKPNVESSPPLRDVPPAGAEKERILIVDDLPGNLLVYQTILEELGEDLVTARSGEEALRLLLKQDFAAILLDVNMPTMNGFETAALIRQRRKSARTPIIFLTAFTDEVSMSQGYASGAVDFLPTPVIPDVLKAKVRVFIELSKMRRQAALQAEERVRRQAAEESARRSALLARLSEDLARPQNQTEVLQALMRLAVPDLGDFSGVWLREGEDATHWREIIPYLQLSSPALPEISWLTQAFDAVVASGYPHIQEAPVAALPKSQKQLKSLLFIPINIQEQPQGIFLVARYAENAAFGVDDAALALELVRRTALVIENVELLHKIREADRRKDEFLGMLAHELRNPLGPIYNSIQVLNLIGSKEPRVGELRDIIDRQAKHMGRLIDDLLDATRLAHGKILLRKERCDLAEIVCQTAEDYRAVIEGSGLKLENCDASEPVWVMGDPTRLTQSVGNLLHNAHKFTKAGGTIRVELVADKMAGKITVTVRDTGIGIEPKMLSCIFDVFRQAEQGLDRSRGGLGLGLALVKGLVELHGGEVHAASEGTDKGSVFTLTLPLDDAAPTAEVADIKPAPQGDQKYRILLIEDNVDAVASAEILLRLEGHEVKSAPDALDGLKMVSSFAPQVIFCDIGLPGMDGYQVVRAIRQDPALAPVYVVALTGYGREEDQRRSLEAGFNLHLTKPIDYESLRRALVLAGQNNRIAS